MGIIMRMRVVWLIWIWRSQKSRLIMVIIDLCQMFIILLEDIQIVHTHLEIIFLNIFMSRISREIFINVKIQWEDHLVVVVDGIISIQEEALVVETNLTKVETQV